MIYGAYEQDFDLLGFSEHGITGKAWDQQPFIRPLYCYQVFTGNSRKPPACDEFAAITDGSAPLENGQAIGKGMFCVTGANELNAVTLSKSHVNGDGVVTLDLDDFNTDEMLYVRCEVYNENGMTYSQAITLDRGAEPLEYKPDTGFKATMQKVGFMLSSARIYVIFAKLIGLIVKAVGK